MPIPAKSSCPTRVLRGSLYTMRGKCGKPTCRCAKGEPHETPVLSYSLGGATKLLTLRPQDLPEVKAALKRYQKEIQALKREALADIHALRRRIHSEKARTRKAKR